MLYFMLVKLFYLTKETAKIYIFLQLHDKKLNFFFYQVQTIVKTNIFPTGPCHLDDEV